MFLASLIISRKRRSTTFIIFFCVILVQISHEFYISDDDEWREDKYTQTYQQRKRQEELGFTSTTTITTPPPLSTTTTTTTSAAEAMNSNTNKKDKNKNIGEEDLAISKTQEQEKEQATQNTDIFNSIEDLQKRLSMKSFNLFNFINSQKNEIFNNLAAGSSDNNQESTEESEEDFIELETRGSTGDLSVSFLSKRQKLYTIAVSSHEIHNKSKQQTEEEIYAEDLKEEEEEEEPFHLPQMTREEKNRNLEQLQRMFSHGYDSYMKYAFPSSEIKPITCQKGRFDLARIPCLTLIDTLDTLLILGNYTEFANAVEKLRHFHTSSKKENGGGIFDLDENVSLFETNIRVLGGLISAHQLITLLQARKNVTIFFDSEADTKTQAEKTQNDSNKPQAVEWVYDGFLLELAIDIGERLLPAFDTETGIPYGTVNLRHGVPIGETTVASLAGSGTLSIEMELLSRLSGDAKYGDAAILATRALFMNKDKHTSLVGKHIDINSGSWREAVSGIGSNSDSFYEYLLKFYALFNAQDFYLMFAEIYAAVQTFIKTDEYWYNDVDMNYVLLGEKRKKEIIESLSAFWPGMQIMLGDLISAKKTLNAFFLIREEWGFLPERYDYGEWTLDGSLDREGRYPLRPELFESAYFMQRSSKSPSWLWAADFAVHALEHLTKTNCGYATIRTSSIPSSEDLFSTESQRNWSTYFNKENAVLEDEMPSYFLAETIKYLYLMFDDDNILHDDDEIQWIFTTEAHPVHFVEDTSRTTLQRKSGKWTSKTTSRRYWEEMRVLDHKFHKLARNTIYNSNYHRNSATTAYMMEQKLHRQSCANYHHPSFVWKHALAIDGALDYEFGYGARIGHGHSLEKLPVQEGLCRIHPTKTRSKLRHQQNQNHKQSFSFFSKPETGKTSDVANSIEVVTTSNGFFARNDKTGESIEAATISMSSTDNEHFQSSTSTSSTSDISDGLVLVITVQNDTSIHNEENVSAHAQWTVLVADWNNHVFRCSVYLTVSNDSDDESATDDKTPISFPCSTAMFGATGMSNLISTLKDYSSMLQITAEVIAPDPDNKYGCNSPDQNDSNDEDLSDKILLLYRGECSFEQKVQNYRNHVKGIIMMNNEAEHLFVMANSSPLVELVDIDTFFVLVTKEDADLITERVGEDSEDMNHDSKDGNKLIANIVIRPHKLPNNSRDDKDESTSTKNSDSDSDFMRNGEEDEEIIIQKEEESNDEQDIESEDNEYDTSLSRFPLVATAPNLLQVLVQQNWGIQSYLQSANGSEKEDKWNIFILQHNGLIDSAAFHSS